MKTSKTIDICSFKINGELLLKFYVLCLIKSDDVDINLIKHIKQYVKDNEYLLDPPKEQLDYMKIMSDNLEQMKIKYTT